jgi:hypothetical protein
MNKNIVKTACVSCAKQFLYVVLGVAAVAGLIKVVFWGSPLIEFMASPWWKMYCAFVLSRAHWAILALWGVPAGIALWAKCVAEKLENAKAYKENRFFSSIALGLGVIALVVLSPTFEIPSTTDLNWFWPAYGAAFVFNGALVSSNRNWHDAPRVVLNQART